MHKRAGRPLLDDRRARPSLVSERLRHREEGAISVGLLTNESLLAIEVMRGSEKSQSLSAY